MSGSIHISLENRFNDGGRFQRRMDRPASRMSTASGDCPSDGGAAGGGGAGAGVSGADEWCRFGLMSRIMNMPTTIRNKRRRIFRFVVRRW